jgi:hypothetical protein
MEQVQVIIHLKEILILSVRLLTISSHYHYYDLREAHGIQRGTSSLQLLPNR